MLIPIQTQINMILYSILAGILTGLLFDIYRIIRGFENPNKVLTFIEDILFWIFAALLVFIFLLYTGYMYVGIHLYIYIALGLYIYVKLMSNYLLKIQYRFMMFLARTLRVTINFLLYPLQLMLCKIAKKNK
ncbi:MULTISPECIES: spore cortex biosynthesis protein YabQ [Clostridium]|uniref:Spore cortex protein SpoYabQ n=2 Tax=Clostridium TaxID=1485 RepID=A0A151ALW1_9CLOT|nr:MULTISPECIES: spore cortex biosynthesis protein YabQ [Clostridium]KYH28635.1 spore cortex protein SpoYabQ [Clostridium colicanis DSM 13634]MBE6045028.1 spore cortex biosynthesis protein YabQ [Clostridium thermopalmarium]PRR73341.1 Spore cortex protein YabQ [Clostridium thermopalmarium DSM 5974]PVZ22173.1 spore cortex biosynthesis protein YabQ [Clostridium thermopalmarium DSM 5974]